MRIPSGNSAASVPISWLLSPKRSDSMLFTEPNERNTMPKSSIPRHAAVNTSFLEYIVSSFFVCAMKPKAHW